MSKFLVWGLMLSAIPLPAQMAVDQKLLDFQQLVALYDKMYAPYEWKRDGLKFDLRQIGPWLDRVRKTKDDFEFLDLCAEYVASLRDSHSQFLIPSNFSADSGLFLDYYDGKVLVDFIDRLLLPERTFPIQIGDELLSVDGRRIEDLVKELSIFAITGNARATARGALDLVVFRPQVVYPRAHQIGSISRFVFRLQNGNTEEYTVRWFKDGEPMTKVGPVPSPFLTRRPASDPAESQVADTEYPLAPRPFRGIPQLRKAKVEHPRAVRGIGSVQPLFLMPAGFTQRLGRNRDAIFSGVFQAEGLRIGFLRVGSMGDSFGGSSALTQIIGELAFMETNTDGLVVDIMRNPGGDVCFAQDFASLLTRERFHFNGAQIRATREWILTWEGMIASYEFAGVDQWVVDILKAMLGDIRGAYSDNRGATGPLPLCDLSLDVEPARNRAGTLLGYTKPVMLLTDDFTASAAELFASAIQDNHLGIVFGMPTMGAGGSISPQAYPTGWYSETSATVTQSIMVRPRNVMSADYPAAPYIENIGIRPDVAGDFQTTDSLLNGGRAFVQKFTEAIVAHINK